MDLSEIMARVRDWLQNVGTTLGFVWRERKGLVILIFVLLSVGLIVWARFGFTVEVGRFFAVQNGGDGLNGGGTTGIDPGCTFDFPKKNAAGKCANSLGQISDYPTTFPGCFIWTMDEEKYAQWREFGTVDEPNAVATAGLPVPRLLNIEGTVIYNNCTWPVKLKVVPKGSVRSGRAPVQADVDTEAAMSYEPEGLLEQTFGSCASGGANCQDQPFKATYDILTYNCGKAVIHIAWEHATAGTRYSWTSVSGEDVFTGIPGDELGIIEYFGRDIPDRPDRDGRRSMYDPGKDGLWDRLTSLFVARAQGLTQTGTALGGRHVNVFNYGRECTGIQGERVPGIAGPIGAPSPPPPAPPGPGPHGGGSTGSGSCEINEFCPAGTMPLGAARNGAEFVDDSNLRWFDFTGGTITLVCGRGLGETNGRVYIAPPPPRKCPDGRSIPASGNYRTLRATNISNFCFGNSQASFDLDFLNPRHVIDCSQHETGYFETYDLPQGAWFFGAIGPGTATAATCAGSPSGTGLAGTSGSVACDGDGSSCPDPTQIPRAATLTVQCGETRNVLTWQDPLSLNAVVNSIIRNVNSEDGEFIFAEGGCYNTFGISTYTDTDVSPGSTYAYRIKTGAQVASNTVVCDVGAQTPTPTPTPTLSPTPSPTPTPSPSPTPTPTVSITPPPPSNGDDDFDNDGIPDDVECPTASQGFCRDSDGDGSPDFADVSDVSAAGITPTGPGDATLLALILAGLTAFMYVSYTHTSLFRRREAELLERDQGPMDFRG